MFQDKKKAFWSHPLKSKNALKYNTTIALVSRNN